MKKSQQPGSDGWRRNRKRRMRLKRWKPHALAGVPSLKKQRMTRTKLRSHPDLVRVGGRLRRLMRIAPQLKGGVL
jgi:hypothetical protein